MRFHLKTLCAQNWVKFDLSFSSFENGPDPDIGVKRTVLSSNIGPIPFSNGAGYRNPKIDELFEHASSTIDPQQRAKLYFEAQEILTKELPYFWLYEPRGASAYNATLRGMYQWSAKSNVYFAQDAWWAGGKRPEHVADTKGKRRWLWFVLPVVAILIAGVMWRKRKKG